MSSNAAPPCLPSVDSSLFRIGCGKFATGITIVTVMGDDGAPHGMTVNSFTSVSLDPPLVLMCIDLKAMILPRLEASEYMGINVLNENQRDISAQFSRSVTDRFEAVKWFPGELGVPLLEDVLATYECGVTSIVEAGDHKMFIANVRHLRCFEGKPLVYFASGYHSLA